jgi:hypothetical protein
VPVVSVVFAWLLRVSEALGVRVRLCLVRAQALFPSGDCSLSKPQPPNLS